MKCCRNITDAWTAFSTCVHLLFCRRTQVCLLSNVSRMARRFQILHRFFFLGFSHDFYLLFFLTFLPNCDKQTNPQLENRYNFLSTKAKHKLCKKKTNFFPRNVYVYWLIFDTIVSRFISIKAHYKHRFYRLSLLVRVDGWHLRAFSIFRTVWSAFFTMFSRFFCCSQE